MVRIQFLLAAACVTLGFAYPRGDTIRVKSGASIQAAIDCASGSDTIIVEAGNYSEQISITKNGITLIGKGAIITPPGTPTTNPCTDLAGPGRQAGICIAGSDIVYVDQPFNGEHKKVKSVGKPVKDASVSGFSVEGFSGLNIAVLGAVDADVKNNTVSSGPQYGILTVGSKRTDIKHNIVLPGGFIGICMDDVSSVEIAHNDVSGYYIGLCVQTSGADIHDNKVHDCCIGALVDPGIVGARLHKNFFSNTAQVCNPEYGVSGVVMVGAKDTVVRGNSFTGLKIQGKAGGVVIVDEKDKVTGAIKAVATGNNVQKNVFSDNDLDIYVDTTGTKNVVKKNTCTSSIPTNLCPGV